MRVHSRKITVPRRSKVWAIVVVSTGSVVQRYRTRTLAQHDLDVMLKKKEHPDIRVQRLESS